MAADKGRPREFSQGEINKLLAVLTPGKDDKEALEQSSQQSDVLNIQEDLTGELDHKGSVIIQGRVLPGSRIRCGGYLTVTGGISGAEVHAEAGIAAPFIEMSRITCENDILVSSHILSSSLLSAGGIYCARGSVISGGRCRAYYTIQADEFGSPFGVRTVLELIRSDPELKTSWDPGERGDPYLLRMVALKKIWEGTLITQYGQGLSVRQNYEGPMVLRSPLKED